MGTWEILNNDIPFQKNKRSMVAKWNGKAALSGLKSVLEGNFGSDNVWSEKIGDQELVDNKIIIKPDYYLFVRYKDQVKKWTLEIKTIIFNDFKDNQVVIKSPQIWTCKNNPKDYPNPYLMAATNRHFWLIPMASFWNGSVYDVRFRDSVKECFILDLDNWEKNEFLVPLDFKGSIDK
jgi:hypothetical protein